MARRDAVRLGAVFVLLLWTLLAPLVAAQEYGIIEEEGEALLEPRQNYQFTGALAIYGSNGQSYSGTSNGGSSQAASSAVPAQCPADHPTSCSSIQQPDYCCAANNYCAWANSVVACCPNGETCSGSPEGAGEAQPSATTVAGGGYVAPATTVYNSPSAAGGYAGYCSTLTAVGPGLPTTQAGQCGTILIVAADAVQAAVLGWARLVFMIAGLHVLGGLVFLRR
ncbi:Hypothetical predicted protein [Lecanosticta acicola]|uniref:Uncharacterized protein n=1 Tax=Lecanosticta acicola TaxID=111012 RepID=A0AAI8YUC1_9PEZI|nr:Hypothetical predicted protein [Lecanosticta acicola]